MTKTLISGIPKYYSEHSVGRGECPGCNYPIIQRIMLETIDELNMGGKTIVVVGAACGTGSFTHTTGVDVIFPQHGQCSDVATAIKRVSPDSLVISVGGDGDCTALGLGSLMSAAIRAENFTTMMLNNGHFAMTGGQMAPTSLVGQVTSTSVRGRSPGQGGYPFHLAEVIQPIQGVAYSARGAVNSPANYQRTKKSLRAALQLQMEKRGFTYLEILSACPVGWHKTPLESLKWINEEMSAEFPLAEFKNIKETP
jgi:2-oxoglutarate ferredoxin oxidoreductase subunit beta